MQNTPNYGLRKPGQEDFYNVDDFNANADIMDTELKNLDTELASVGTDITNINAEISNLETNKLDKTGDASNVKNTFTQASTRANLVSGENQSTTFGKLMKWFADLKPVAWSGNASDLTEDASNRLVTDTEKGTWNGKAGTAVATPSSNGLMSSTDKTKLDGVATNANNYVHPSSHPASMTTQDSTHRFVTDTEKTTWNGKLDKSGGTMTGVLYTTGGVGFNTNLEAQSKGFTISSETGYVYMYAPASNTASYLKKSSGSNNDYVTISSTLRLGDVAIHTNDVGEKGENHIYRQIPTIDFGVESRNNEEGEECIFLLDILESMQNKINSLETELTILKGQ